MSWLDTILSWFSRRPAQPSVPAPTLSAPTPVPVIAPWRLTAGILADALQIPMSRASTWYTPLDEAMNRFSIDTPAQRAMFLAQIGHESGRLVYVRELWGPTNAQLAYEGRVDLGNTQPNDGKKYLGRGLIQITGRANYKACGNGLGMDLVTYPELLEAPDNAALSAAWFWYSRGLNVYATDITTCTRKINGGLNGLDDREVLWNSCKTALGIQE